MGPGSTAEASTGSPIKEFVTEHQLGLAIAIYVVVAVPVYFWLEGPVGIEGTVDGSVAAIGLALGTILVVPVFRALLRKYAGETESARLGLTDTGAK